MKSATTSATFYFVLHNILVFQEWNCFVFQIRSLNSFISDDTLLPEWHSTLRNAV